MKSMTGFGRAEIDSPAGKMIAEVQSVNRKYLEVHVSLPKEFTRFENDVRKLVGEFVSRGAISVRFYIQPNPMVVTNNLPDAEILKNLKKSWEELALAVGYPKTTIDLPFLLAHADIPHSKAGKEDDFTPLQAALKPALESLEKMKRAEGVALSKDIQSRLREMTQKVEMIEKLSPDAVSKLRIKLKERMEELFKPGTEELDDRLLRETAMFAERLDISEEITRFRSHIDQYTELLKGKEAGGRKMDFLVQEMGREINTMGSKSMDAKIAHLVVEVKSELEKVREQIQNIE